LNEAEQVISLVNNPDRAAAFGAAARKRMVERYSWDAQLASLRTMVFPEALDKAA
jgi:polysaccharide biosynthesis protein PslH